MAAMFSNPVSAVQVGSYFLGQYYHVLQEQPNAAYQFYTNSSSAMRIDGEKIDNANGMMQIHSLIMTLNFTGIEIKTAHSVDSWDGGVLVMVSGYVQTKDYSGRRKFVETFFLAPQEKGYFVLNDIFHFLDEETIPEPSATSLAYANYKGNLNVSNDSNHISEPVSGYMLREEIQAGEYSAPVHVLAEEIEASNYVAPGHVLAEEIQASNYIAPVHADEIEQVDDYSVSESPHQVYSVPEPPQQVSEPDDRTDEMPAEEPTALSPITTNMEREAPPAPSDEPAGERPKLTYASILRLAKGQPETSMPHAAPLRKIIPVIPDAPVATSQQPYLALSTRPDKSSPDAVIDVTTIGFEDEGDTKSVYVGNLPSSVSASDLEHEFKNFGRIRPDGVSVRSRKDSGGFYAFVEFEDSISIQNALKASPILLNGRQIYVEERRPNGGISRGGRGGGGRGRGRGGYQSEASRGRFGGRSYGRGGNDNNDRDFSSSRPRGNGVQQSVPHQERGILGNHALRNGSY